MTKYKILLLEDSVDDAELVQFELKKQGIRYELLFVSSKEEYIKAINKANFNVILADYNLPNFNALDALEMIKAKELDLPFIIVSGNIGEIQAVAAMKAGAHDYVFKSNLARLGQVIKREFEEAQNRDESRRNQQALVESEAKYRLLVENQNELLLAFDTAYKIEYANPKYCEIFGKNLDELIGNTFFDFIHKDDLDRVKKSLKLVFSPPYAAIHEERANTLTGYKWFRWSVKAEVKNKKATLFIAVGQEISEIVNVQKQLEDSEKSLRKLTEYLQDIREKERTSIAREIHDEVGQMLTAIKMDITFLKKLEQKDEILNELENIILLTDRTISEVKSIITKLRPGVLDDLGLSAAVDWLVGEYTNRTSFECALLIDINDDEIDKVIATNIFRVIQEGLTNIARHAKASKASVSLIKEDKRLVLKISDNGIGMPENMQIATDSFGLLGMKERILSLNGSFRINKAEPSGTWIDIRIPI